MSAKGSLAIVLHAHLPYIRHMEAERFLEEDWFFEAVTECYIPLIATIERLSAEYIRAGLTISLSPTLCALLEDPGMSERCHKYIKLRLELLQKELERIPHDSPAERTALMYRQLFEQARNVLIKFDGNLITAFRQLQEKGQIEVITTTATHAILPIMIHPEAVRAQVLAAVNDYAKRFGVRPKGLWLPECAFTPQIISALQLSGIKYIFLEKHALDLANPRPRNGVFSPVLMQGGLFAYARDAQSAREVWSSKYGYPGSPQYREFYRDLGFDADYEYIRPYLHADGIRRSLGIKYHKITGNVHLADKAPYDPAEAAAQAEEHAKDFLAKRLRQIEQINTDLGIRPVITGTYDAELFGHWWLEGPAFLENVLRGIRKERLPLQMITASEGINAGHDNTEIKPEPASWGEGGYFEPWINEKNDWIYPRLNAAAERMIEIANRFQNIENTPLQTRALNQAARELLLAQSSDWAFLLYVQSHAPYAEKRVCAHTHHVFELANMLSENDIKEEYVQSLEKQNPIFSGIDYRIFASPSSF
ncbi:MAG: 1,4-alpha-glucan branching protein domain-containing protein [Elusimicrobiaceae bacterium]